MRSLEDFRNQLLLVVGDMMVDKYIMGSVDRISPEAPVPVLRQNETRRKLGGAGNVIINATSLGAKVRAVGRVGNDGEGTFFCEALREVDVDDRYIFAEGSTIVKTRVSACGQQFIRIDEEVITHPSSKISKEIIDKLDNIFQNVTAVVISDYAKGFITEELAQAIINKAKTRRIPVIVDPKGRSAAKYKGATALTPNNKEFLDLTGISEIPCEKDIKNEALRLCAENGFDYLIFTRSEKGISVISRASSIKKDFPATVKEVVDVTGAGDTVVSTIALALGAGFNLHECVDIANMAASIVISKFGAAQTTLEELSVAFYPQTKGYPEIDLIVAQIKSLKRQGKRIVFTNGCFDIVHAGHVSSFRQARSFGDVLVVGVNSNESICRLKGEFRPIIDLKYRIALLSELNCVDFVIPFNENTPQALIEYIKPDVLVKGNDWAGEEIAGGEFVRSNGGRVEFIELEQGLSTSSIIDKIKQTIQ